MRVMLAVLCLSVGVQTLPPSSTHSCETTESGWNLEELERVLFSVAREKGVAPTVILNRLLRKHKARQRAAKGRNRSQLQQLALNELLGSIAQPPPFPNGGNSALPPSLPPTGQLSPPGSAMVRPRLGIGPQVPGEISYPVPPHPPPAVRVQPDARTPPFFIPVQSFKPPPGVTIRVNSNGAAAAVLPDVTVTISPMMTVLEALRQADYKFRAALGIESSSEDVMQLTFSPYSGCYVLNRFYDIASTDHVVWKIIVSDSRGQVIYDSTCLPSRNEVPVKPGTTILLSYTSLSSE